VIFEAVQRKIKKRGLLQTEQLKNPVDFLHTDRDVKFCQLIEADPTGYFFTRNIKLLPQKNYSPETLSQISIQSEKITTHLLELQSLPSEKEKMAEFDRDLRGCGGDFVLAGLIKEKNKRGEEEEGEEELKHSKLEEEDQMDVSHLHSEGEMDTL
jgi:hypothetical protein